VTHVIDVFIGRRGGQLWTYRVPDTGMAGLQAGDALIVPFARQNQLGVVADAPRRHKPATDPPLEKCRTPLARLSPALLPPDLVTTLRWLSRYTMTPLARVLSGTVPLAAARWRQDTRLQASWLRAQESIRNLAVRPVAGAAPALRSRQARTAWGRLTAEAPLPVAALSEIYRDPAAVVRRWHARGWIELTAAPTITAASEPPTLYAEQAAATGAIAKSVTAADGGRHLLAGITGSGKTEVYLAAAQAALAQGRRVLVLVPEIALAYPMLERLQARLGARGAIWHSALPDGQRRRTLYDLLHGALSYLVGARSALYAPIDNLGLIVVDEAHDSGYLDQDRLAVNTRDVAGQRARYAGATLVLGSATPSVELVAAARDGRLHEHRLTRRAHPDARPPKTSVVNLTEYALAGPYAWCTRPLEQALAATLARGEQAILLRNRRGFHPTIYCRACGETLECDHCSTTLSLHANPARLRCHLCNFEAAWQEFCPHCGEPKLAPAGSGTQRIDHELGEMFPEHRIARLDRDVRTSGTRLETLLASLAQGEIDLLIGTQMVAKGHDFANVTLVAIIDMDAAFDVADFRGRERAFQLLCQVAGRTGRGAKPGHVLIQTRNPDHPVIRQAIAQDVSGFVEDELARRRQLGFPPFRKLLRAVWQHPQAMTLNRLAHRAVAAAQGHDIRVLGPAPAPLERRRDQYRYHALALADTYAPLRRWADAVRRHSTALDVVIEVDPQQIW